LNRICPSNLLTHSVSSCRLGTLKPRKYNSLLHLFIAVCERVGPARGILNKTAVVQPRVCAWTGLKYEEEEGGDMGDESLADMEGMDGWVLEPDMGGLAGALYSSIPDSASLSVSGDGVSASLTPRKYHSRAATARLG
jgi:hypothetical protein